MTNPQQHLIFLTNRVGRQFSRILLEGLEFEAFSPQSTHMGLLADLMIGDGQRQQDLAISSIKDKATVARALKQMEQAAFIRRDVDPADRRQKRIYLTDKGHRLWSYATARAECTTDRATANIPTADLAVCTDVLQRIYRNLYGQMSSSPTNSIVTP